MQDKQSSRVRSTEQIYIKIWNLAPFACGKTRLCIETNLLEIIQHTLHKRILITLKKTRKREKSRCFYANDGLARRESNATIRYDIT